MTFPKAIKGSCGIILLVSQKINYHKQSVNSNYYKMLAIGSLATLLVILACTTGQEIDWCDPELCWGEEGIHIACDNDGVIFKKYFDYF